MPAFNANIDSKVNAADAIINFNFRPDRAIEISYAMTNAEFSEFEVNADVNSAYFVCLMPYAEKVHGDIAFTPMNLVNTFGDVLAANGLKQLRIAETEKYPHVTFFFDGGVDREIENANRVLVASPKVATYDLQPEMSAIEVTDKLIAELDHDYDVVILNLANGDMVGHTGFIKETIEALEVVDNCVARIAAKVTELDGAMFITADHGNAEAMMNEDGSPITAHSLNPVHFTAVNADIKMLPHGTLADIAPTILEYVGLEIPAEMDGKSLLVK